MDNFNIALLITGAHMLAVGLLLCAFMPWWAMVAVGGVQAFAICELYERRAKRNAKWADRAEGEE